MRNRSLVLLMAIVIVVTGCQGPPPTAYIIVTSTVETPEPTETPIVVIVTATSDPSAVTPVNPANSTPTDTPEATAAVAGIPTPTIAQIQAAEQRFQRGRMFWLQPNEQIWVMVETEDGGGVWTIHEDLFEEGDVEFDPDIVAPDDLFQPERGFGRLWRDNDEVREAIGWALEPERGFVSNYEYQPEGEVVEGVYVREPGYHLLTSFEGETFRFNEINGTWQLLAARSARTQTSP